MQSITKITLILNLFISLNLYAQENLPQAVGQAAEGVLEATGELIEYTSGVIGGRSQPYYRDALTEKQAPERFVRERGLYIGGQFGISQVSLNNNERNEEGVNFQFTAEDDDLASKWYCGYWINRNVSLELSHGSLGKVTVPFNFQDPRNGREGTGEAEVDISGLTTSFLIGMYKSGWHGYLRLGANSWSRNLESRFDVVGEESVRRMQSKSGTGYSIGLGASYEFTHGWMLRAEAEQNDIDGDTVNVFSVGLQYDFGSIRSWMWD